MVAGVLTYGRNPVPSCASVATSMCDHQKEAVAWMVSREGRIDLAMGDSSTGGASPPSVATPRIAACATVFPYPVQYTLTVPRGSSTTDHCAITPMDLCHLPGSRDDAHIGACLAACRTTGVRCR